MTMPSLPPVPRLPKTTTLPSADLIETPDQLDTGRGADQTDDLGRPGDTDSDLTPRYPQIADLARKIADFEPGWQGRIADHVRTTARAGVLVLLAIMLWACGQGPVPLPADPEPVQVPAMVPAAPVPAQVPPKTTTPPAPSRLRLPTVWVMIEGQRVPVGPLMDQDLGRPCQLQALADGSALCVPTDTVKIEAQSETGYLDIDCAVGVAKLSGALEAWDGSKVWHSLTGMPEIPAGTATVAQRDQTGACRPARVIMSGGGWGFTSSPTPAALVFALVKRIVE